MRWTLLDEVKGGFSLARRRWPMMVPLAGLIALSTVVLSFALVDVLSQFAVIRGAYQLQQHRAVFFTPFYPAYGEVSHVEEETVRYLMDWIDRQQAYTAIVYNMALDDPTFAGGYPTLILFGDVVPDLFPDMRLCAPAPCAMRGAQVVEGTVEAVDVGGESIRVAGRLARGATFFDVNAAGLPLDHRVVIRAPTRAIPRLNAIEQEELLTRAVFLNPSDTTIYTFVSMAARGRLFLVPHYVSVEQPRHCREIMMRSAMYIGGMLAFLSLAFTAFVSSARSIIQSERRSFKIRQMYGATPLHLSLRIGSFLASVIVLPQMILLTLLQAFLRLTGAPAPDAPAWVLLGLFLVFGFLWLSLVREVLAKEDLRGW